MIPDYELTGPPNAPVLVLSNSLGTDRTMWDEQLPELSSRFRVLRYDQRGHGKTPATPGPYELETLGRDVLDLLDHLEIVRVRFAGVSLGGMTGMWLAANAPERIERLALLCTSAALGTPEDWRERAAFVRANGTGAMVDSTLGRWFTAELSSRRDVVAKYGGMVATTDDESYAGCCEAIAGMTLEGRLGGITAPTLVVAGYDDPATPPEHAERIAAGIPNARLAVLERAAHLANVEQAERVNRLLVEHFASEGEPMSTASGEAATARTGTGMAVRRQVLGDEHVDRAIELRTEFTEPFQDFITRYAWGELWASEGMDRPTRSCVTLAILAATGCHDELAMHVRAARRNGVEASTIREVLMHVAVYAGVPKANSAFALADRILGEEADGNGA
ncbi:3-oxoadipate enol-lactonase / 4-carboxymuconolactone decarboxylase [Actinopolyspora xinjiangensis]|uniref:3-oxoadipate enol-lactonase / 4-carboxymuconolactone decarboxylase n=1 Tax=Actinopolyspora xinjiangensis TaxID=405564 RepID=A0A1H0WN42_9ACTN|nr:3-oxoadipate enol-lactonase [Actinopolyspora xinjiangensis]SDP92134.1 3-oxoadipate enol-lactonase / 4-carboxymuconolactone decarboxylase [Actinopolyspora xinjiangensis]